VQSNAELCQCATRGQRMTIDHRWAGVLSIFDTLLFTACATGNSPRKSIDRGNSYFEKRDYARVILEYRNAIQTKPHDPEAHYRMSLAVLETGDVKPAVVLLRKALSLDPKPHRFSGEAR
jgi:Tfp pilus assembly protein PilF